MTRLSRVLSVVAVAAFLLTACGGRDEPTPDVIVAPSPAPAVADQPAPQPDVVVVEPPTEIVKAKPVPVPVPAPVEVVPVPTPTPAPKPAPKASPKPAPKAEPKATPYGDDGSTPYSDSPAATPPPAPAKAPAAADAGLRVRAKITAVSRVPEPGEVAYKDCLTMIKYDVVSVQSGSYDGSQLLAAHQGMVDGKQTAAARYKVGQTLTLDLEPLADHPDKSRQMMADDTNEYSLEPYWVTRVR